MRENNYKSFNSLESEESSVGSSGETPSEKETRYLGFYKLCLEYIRYTMSGIEISGVLYACRVNWGNKCPEIYEK